MNQINLADRLTDIKASADKAQRMTDILMDGFFARTDISGAELIYEFAKRATEFEILSDYVDLLRDQIKELHLDVKRKGDFEYAGKKEF